MWASDLSLGGFRPLAGFKQLLVFNRFPVGDHPLALGVGLGPLAGGGLLGDTTLILDFLNLTVLLVADGTAQNGASRRADRSATPGFAGLMADNATQDGTRDRARHGAGLGILGRAIGGAAGAKERREQQGRARGQKDKSTTRFHGMQVTL
jgi:hypothetical protein